MLEGDITATGTTSTTTLHGEYNMSLSGFGDATVALQRSINGGTTWSTIEAFTADAEKSGDAAGAVLYRFNCTAYTSGTIHYILSN